MREAVVTEGVAVVLMPEGVLERLIPKECVWLSVGVAVGECVVYVKKDSVGLGTVGVSVAVAVALRVRIPDTLGVTVLV